jgi:uncharacterized protein
MSSKAQLKRGFDAVGLSLYCEREDALVFSDTHLGYEGHLNRQGVLIPRFQYKEIKEHISKALELVNPGRVIINGDLKHEFGGMRFQEQYEVKDLLDMLEPFDVTIVRGNHDTIRGPLRGFERVKIVDKLLLGTTLFVHGHSIPNDAHDADTIVIGHEHPCIGLEESGRTETVKAFLVGGWRGRDLIVMPSLNYVSHGTDMLRNKTISPFLRQDISEFRVFAVEDWKTMEFGKIRDLIGLR